MEQTAQVRGSVEPQARAGSSNRWSYPMSPNRALRNWSSDSSRSRFWSCSGQPKGSSG
jgi:hypothetical protein